MTLTRWLAAVVVSVVFVLPVGAAPGPDGSVSSLLEKAIYSEQTAGDLDAAMRLFQKVAADGQATRRQAAQAQYHLGLCQLKKKQPDAAAQTFRTVVAQYSDQKDIAEQAQQKLGDTGSTGNGQGSGHSPAQPGRPGVIATVPQALSNDVDPSLDKITVTFNYPMSDRGYSWTGSGPTYPQATGKPSYDTQRRTCTLPVKLEPGKVYWIGVNSKDFKGFRTAAGAPVPWYAILFATRSADGKPTPLPPDLLAQARAINQISDAQVGTKPKGPPKVVRSVPKALSDNVPASLDKITVTFDQAMLDGNWSWAGGGDTYPQTPGKPSYDAGRRTCTLPVKLEPGKVYWVGVNSPDYQNFRAADGTPAARYVVLFATASADGKPTPIPQDLLDQAREINGQAAVTDPGGNAGATDSQVQKRPVGKAVAIFPEQVDLSTPEGAAAAWNRASGKMDAQALAGMSWQPIRPEEMEAFWKSADRKDIDTYNKAQLAGVIVEVYTYKDDFAGAVTFLSFPPGVGRSPYSLRYLGKADGQWKNMGEDRLANVGEARQTFQRKMELISNSFHQLQAGAHPEQQKDVTIREINKTVKEFPEPADVSTPEGACAAWQRANARMDAKAIASMSQVPLDPQQEEQFFKRLRAEDPENIFLNAIANSTIVKVLTYKDDVAEVITYLPFPPGKGRSPYSGRSFVRVNGQWKNMGEDRFPSADQAVGKFITNRDIFWKHAQELLGGTVQASDSAKTAPVDADRQKAIEQIFADPEPIVTQANEIFQAIRTADYDRWINGEGWHSFPLTKYYQTYQWYDVLVPWICKTFKADPIQDVTLGKAVKNEDGLPAIPYKLTLASGKVMEGVLPFNHGDSGWYARYGLDWHLGNRMHLTDAKPQAAGGPGQAAVKDINKPVSAFAAGDLSTPESAAANYNLASGNMDAKALAAVSLVPIDAAQMKRDFEASRADMEVYNKAQVAATIVQALVYRDGVAMVITKLNFPEGVGRHPYSGRMFGLFSGQWKNMGEDRYPTPEAARAAFEKVKDMVWEDYVQTVQGMQGAGSGGGGGGTIGGKSQSSDLKDVQRRKIDRSVSQFPDTMDLSSPEAACASWMKAYARHDAKGVVQANGACTGITAREQRSFFAKQRKDDNDPMLSAQIVEVLTYRDDLADVIVKVTRPDGRSYYSCRGFGNVSGQWKNMGENPAGSVQQAEREFAAKKDKFWEDCQGLKTADAIQQQAEQNPEIIEAEAQWFFNAIRNADYNRNWLNGDDWQSFPIHGRYETATGWPDMVMWICRTFRQNPIVDVQLGKGFKNADGLMAVHYKLTLKDGAVLENDLPFYWEYDHWCGKQGIDWHLKYRNKPLVARSAGAANGPATQPTADARTTR